ncbi:aftiphilin-like [Saccostrea cucullata]|uniref:aftiphilin-like n=1 Tax=Saccostrea cuccullata TaxID=36930 RepID=UPI002ED30FFC
MSGVIPMVSASPPPFEEDGGDDWDADFGNFMGADQNVSEHSETGNWAAFPDSVPATRENSASPSHLSQEKENVQPTETDIKLNLNCSNVISGSDSGLELDSSNVTVSKEYRQGMELQIDSGLCSTEVSPCDPGSVVCDEKDPKSMSTTTACDVSKQSSQSSNEDSNEELEDNSEIMNKSENIQTSVSSNQMDHCSESVEKDDSVNMGDSDDNGSSVQDISANQECIDNVVLDSSSVDLRTESKSSEVIPKDDDDDWGDFGEINENVNSATSENLGTDQVNEKSIANPTDNTEEHSENQKDLPPKLESDINLTDLPKYIEDKFEGKETLEEETETVKGDIKSELGENSSESLDKDKEFVCEGEDTDNDFNETNFTAPDADWTPVVREDNKGLDEEENPCQLDKSEKNTTDEEKENTEDRKKDIDDVCIQSETNPASGLDGEDDEFDDFADFGSAPSNNLEFKKEEVTVDDNGEENNDDDFEEFADFDAAPSNDLDFKREITVHDEQENDDDFNDFADFDSAPSNDLETEKDTKSSDQFASFPKDSAASGDGNWASFQETSDSGEAKDSDWKASKDEWSNNDTQGGDQWKQGGDEEWGEGGGDDFGDFGDFDEEPTQPIQKEKVDELSSRAVTSCFHGDVNDRDPGNIITSLDNYVHDKESDPSPEKSSRVWGSLTKQATESPLKWSQSRSNKQLFSSLKIDTRNILIGHKKPSVPIYASNLTLLEPTKGPAKPTKPEPTLVDTNKEEPQKQDIPPVQFDWSSSGLVNPLQGDSSKSLDLDFLVVQETESGGRSGVFDSELMHGQKPNLQPLENILANLKVSTVKKNRQTDKLGAEATKIIKTLPDLSFMQAKVLMFPIRHQAE